MSSYYNRYNRPAFRSFDVDEQIAWSNAILERYGVALRFRNDVYVDPRTGCVFAGSEYVATLYHGANYYPESAHDWTVDISTLPTRY